MLPTVVVRANALLALCGRPLQTIARSASGRQQLQTAFNLACIGRGVALLPSGPPMSIVVVVVVESLVHPATLVKGRYQAIIMMDWSLLGR